MRLLIFFLFNIVSLALLSQTTANDTLVKYTPNFKLKQGIYIRFEQVKTNNPIPLERIVATVDTKDFGFFNQIFEKDIVEFYDDFGSLQKYKKSDIWGFCRKGNIFIQYNNDFFRIPIVGKICHFVADKTVYQTPNYSPYHYYNSYHYSYNPYPTTTSSKVLQQYILDFDSGKVYDFSLKSMKILMMNDPELYDEFNDLKKRKQKKKIYFYLRKYNEKNPLYFPVKNK